jgi:hypothetical protein
VDSAFLDRLPPQNEEAEISVLGAILQDSNALLVCLDMFQPEDFYKRAHQKIYAACQTIFERQVAIDLVTMANELSGSRPSKRWAARATRPHWWTPCPPRPTSPITRTSSNPRPSSGP